MANYFRFKQFSVCNERSALKVGTDAVLLGAAMSIPAGARRALDIGTGTGVIALMLAQRCGSVDVDAIDIDAPSVEEASANFAASPWSRRLRALEGDLRRFTPKEFACVSNEADSASRHACAATPPVGQTADDPARQAGKPVEQAGLAGNEHALPQGTQAPQSDEAAPCYDLIFSNPPFFDDSLLNPDGREATARHSKSLTLSDICAFAAERLKPSGSLSLIVPADRAQALRRIAASFGLLTYRIIQIQTTPRKPVKRCIIEFSKQSRAIEEKAITLMDNGRRSEEYQELTREFYL